MPTQHDTPSAPMGTITIHTIVVTVGGQRSVKMPTPRATRAHSGATTLHRTMFLA